MAIKATGNLVAADFNANQLDKGRRHVRAKRLGTLSGLPIMAREPENWTSIETELMCPDAAGRLHDIGHGVFL